jgi:hypothetical protein
MNNGGMILTGGNRFVHQSSLEIIPVEPPSSKVGGTGEGNHEFGLKKYLY